MSLTGGSFDFNQLWNQGENYVSDASNWVTFGIDTFANSKRCGSGMLYGGLGLASLGYGWAYDTYDRWGSNLPSTSLSASAGIGVGANLLGRGIAQYVGNTYLPYVGGLVGGTVYDYTAGPIVDEATNRYLEWNGIYSQGGKKLQKDIMSVVTPGVPSSYYNYIKSTIKSIISPGDNSIKKTVEQNLFDRQENQPSDKLGTIAKLLASATNKFSKYREQDDQSKKIAFKIAEKYLLRQGVTEGDLEHDPNLSLLYEGMKTNEQESIRNERTGSIMNKFLYGMMLSSLAGNVFMYRNMKNKTDQEIRIQDDKTNDDLTSLRRSMDMQNFDAHLKQRIANIMMLRQMEGGKFLPAQAVQNQLGQQPLMIEDNSLQNAHLQRYQQFMKQRVMADVPQNQIPVQPMNQKQAELVLPMESVQQKDSMNVYDKKSMLYKVGNLISKYNHYGERTITNRGAGAKKFAKRDMKMRDKLKLAYNKLN